MNNRAALLLILLVSLPVFAAKKQEPASQLPEDVRERISSAMRTYVEHHRPPSAKDFYACVLTEDPSASRSPRCRSFSSEFDTGALALSPVPLPESRASRERRERENAPAKPKVKPRTSEGRSYGF